MARLSTCKQCGQKITIDQKKIYQNKTYCSECYDNIVYENEQYKKLISMIDELAKSKDESIPPIVFKQIKDYKENKNLNYGGMQYTLWYITEVLKQDIDLQTYGIVLILYEYHNAENWYNKQCAIEQSAEKIIFKNNNDIKLNNFFKFKPNYNYIDLEVLIKTNL